ncbi:MAG: site-2 protease family protein [Chlamydiota bacterium]
MLIQIFYAFLGILGIGFLIFIHELGHYFMARRKKMKVEAFSIGFGKAIYSWKHQGVVWQIGWLPLGGYVKIAGMQKEGNREPCEIANGFFGKKPWDRIQVAFMGPFVNFLFAFLAFFIIWFSGGREKGLSEYSRHVGYVSTSSLLYEKGIRPGDEITVYGNRPYGGIKDLFYTAARSDAKLHIQGYKIDYYQGKKEAFDYTFDSLPKDANGLSMMGMFSPASELIYERILPNGEEGGALENTSLSSSGIQSGDRIVWADGSFLFSRQELTSIVNSSLAFLTVQRGDEIFQVRVPRVLVKDIKGSSLDRSEIDDWKHEAKLKERVGDLYVLPYQLDENMTIQGPVEFVDEGLQKKVFTIDERNPLEKALQKGDQILSVAGNPITSPSGLLQELQDRKVLLVVERKGHPISWKEVDQEFERLMTADMQKIVASIGSSQPIANQGNFVLLQPIKPQTTSELYPFSMERKNLLMKQLAEYKKHLEQMLSKDKREDGLQKLEKSENRLFLGLSLVDKKVQYNPFALTTFVEVFKDTWFTLSSLVTGHLHPKWVSGPVGIVHVMQKTWMVGWKEVLFLLGLLSVNLGILNLLPIPVLDGGYIVISLIEMITKKRMKAKTMEKLIIPFVVLLIGFIIFVTYQDLLRLFWH